MASNILKFLVLQCLIFKVFTSSPYAPTNQFVQYSQPPYKYGPPPPNYNPNYEIPPSANRQGYVPPNPPPAVLSPLASLNLPNFPLVQVPRKLPSTSCLPSVSAPNPMPTSSNPPKLCSALDSEVINNLAIALQYLIASHILNVPLPESEVKSPISVSSYPFVNTPVSSTRPRIAPLHSYAPMQLSSPVNSIPLSQPQNKFYQLPPSNPSMILSTPMVSPKPVSYYTINQPQVSFSRPNYDPAQGIYPAASSCPCAPPPVMPNANFVGSSSYVDSGSILSMNPYGPPTSLSPRTMSLSLMSPYEAISPNSPFSDGILTSPYGSVISSKNDLQSPYSAMMADSNKDLFSMDLF